MCATPKIHESSPMNHTITKDRWLLCIIKPATINHKQGLYLHKNIKSPCHKMTGGTGKYKTKKKNIIL